MHDFVEFRNEQQFRDALPSLMHIATQWILGYRKDFTSLGGAYKRAMKYEKYWEYGIPHEELGMLAALEGQPVLADKHLNQALITLCEHDWHAEHNKFIQEVLSRTHNASQLRKLLEEMIAASRKALMLTQIEGALLPQA